MSSPVELEAPIHAVASRTGLSKECLQRGFLNNLFFELGKFPGLASQHNYYHEVHDE
jgi:hypothetical protein